MHSVFELLALHSHACTSPHTHLRIHAERLACQQRRNARRSKEPQLVPCALDSGRSQGQFGTTTQHVEACDISCTIAATAACQLYCEELGAFVRWSICSLFVKDSGLSLPGPIAHGCPAPILRNSLIRAFDKVGYDVAAELTHLVELHFELSRDSIQMQREQRESNSGNSGLGVALVWPQ